jgi:hypothetical protein
MAVTTPNCGEINLGRFLIFVDSLLKRVAAPNCLKVLDLEANRLVQCETASVVPRRRFFEESKILGILRYPADAGTRPFKILNHLIQNLG